MTAAETRHVAAAVVLHGSRVLVQTRARGDYAGSWEFPGGGVEDGEQAEACARRECLEECGLSVEVGARLHVEEWEYPGRRVRVEFFLCRPAGEPRPRALLGQTLRWADRDDLGALSFLPANGPVLALLREHLGRAGDDD